MKYVSSLLLGGRVVKSACLTSLSLMQGLEIEVDGKKYDQSDVSMWAAGVGFDSNGHMCVASYTEKELKVFDYVEEVINAWVNDISHDAYIIAGGGDYRGSGKSVYINTVSEIVSTCDVFGAVFKIEDKYTHERYVVNLWDLLGYYCKKCGMNIMRFSKIYFSPGGGSRCSCIKLLDTPEATRFFAKMYMDVVR